MTIAGTRALAHIEERMSIEEEIMLPKVRTILRGNEVGCATDIGLDLALQGARGHSMRSINLARHLEHAWVLCILEK